ncbi:hypothetical protein GCM10010252_26010 [Streptomyces aureoverticillatus]|nr:hypothetical protein GCM10010252_26010 [Streptomyces aureoverticillatus]
MAAADSRAEPLPSYVSDDQAQSGGCVGEGVQVAADDGPLGGGVVAGAHRGAVDAERGGLQDGPLCHRRHLGQLPVAPDTLARREPGEETPGDQYRQPQDLVGLTQRALLKGHRQRERHSQGGHDAGAGAVQHQGGQQRTDQQQPSQTHSGPQQQVRSRQCKSGRDREQQPPARVRCAHPSPSPRPPSGRARRGNTYQPRPLRVAPERI